MRLTDDALTAAREVVVAEAAAASVPEVSYGILSGGQVAAGQGTDRIYRIASMTKSFTAAAVLGICRGLIPVIGRRPSLDDLLADWLPALSTGEWAAEITIRDALTMSTGLPKDDPWADRLESMPISQMQRLMQGQALTNFPPGAGFEYANYGYAMLGAFVEAATGNAFTEVVHLHLLEPLGLASTGFDVRQLDADRLVTGYRRTTDGELEAQPISLPGAFSAIGGLASTVDDVARWVTALIDAVTSTEPGDACRALGRTGAEARAWRRVLADLQQTQRPINIQHADDHAVAIGYGYGLRCSYDSRYGHTAGHSGGYPGFGLHMRWHATTGTGVIVLANLTDFPAEAVATRALNTALAIQRAHDPGSRGWPSPRPVPMTPAQQTSGSAETDTRPVSVPVEPLAGFPVSDLARTRQLQAETMIATGDDAEAERIFSSNMDLDMPRAERLAAWQRIRDHAGTPADDGTTAQVEWLTALSARWEVWADGEAGTGHGRRMEMMLNPAGEIQKLTVTAVPQQLQTPHHAPGS